MTSKYPECLKAIPVLLAVRSYEIYCQDENISLNYHFDRAAHTPEHIFTLCIKQDYLTCYRII
ncbi:MAG: hypothetical protein II884_04945 [Synergistaceae bacterium]|nr:hypothetical protein [Synergistaceae bacterium]